MALEFMDKISKYLPSIQGPKKPLSLREKMYWTAGILVIYFLLYNTYAIGVNAAAAHKHNIRRKGRQPHNGGNRAHSAI